MLVFQEINKTLQLNFTVEEIKNFKAVIVDEYLPTALLADLVATGVYVVICALMVIGVLCDMRGMMIPYLMVQMLFIIVAIIVLLGFTIALFFIEASTSSSDFHWFEKPPYVVALCPRIRGFSGE